LVALVPVGRLSHQQK